MLPVVVEQVRPEITYGLRAEVLRPGLAPMAARFPGDDAETALHFAAYDRADRIVGVVAVLPEAMPGEELRESERPLPEGRPWRLRGMAVHSQERCEGVGRALMLRVLDGVARSGGGLLWCNARVPAAGFYERFGFARLGEPWEDPQFGPHVRMSRKVGPDEICPPPEEKLAEGIGEDALDR
jgi:predicted GNAT family N-acyltransferase